MSKKGLLIIGIIGLITLSAVLFSYAGKNPSANDSDSNAPVKEFTMKSFVEFVGNQPRPQFDVKEITVNKGDRVRLKVTVTRGVHDFNIDAYNIHEDTKLDQEKIIEFVADKAGVFEYYCNQPGHRANGHVGTLRVLES